MISLKMVGLIGLWSSLWGCQRTRTVSKLPILRTREMMILNSFERMPMLGTRWLRQAFDLYCDGCGRRDEVWRRVVNAGKKPKGIVTGGYTMPIGTFDCVKYGGKYTIIFY